MQFRSILKVVSGHLHGAGGIIKRLISPDDLGQILKPFVFFDHLEGFAPITFGFGYHPHSGIATVTYNLNTPVAYTDTEEQNGILAPQGVEWMQAGGGAWHKGKFTEEGNVCGFQLWLALPQSVENGPSNSQYIMPSAVPIIQIADGCLLKVLVGEYKGTKAPIQNNPFTDEGIAYMDIHLGAGREFIYEYPIGHTVSWAYVYQGTADINGTNMAKNLIVFEPTGTHTKIQADSNARILLASAKPTPHELVVGYSSVHTSKAALDEGLRKIEILGQDLRAKGKL